LPVNNSSQDVSRKLAKTAVKIKNHRFVEFGFNLNLPNNDVS
jgi:hypothetical protein